MVENLPEFSIRDVMLSQPNEWSPLPSNRIQRGLNPEASWVAVDVKNLNAEPLEMVLYFDRSNLDRVSFNQTSRGQVIHSMLSGDTLPFANRPLASHLIGFPFELKGLEEQTLYFQVTTAGAHNYGVFLLDRDEFYDRLLLQNLVFGAFFGMQGLLAIYNFFVYLISRDRNNLYFIGFIISTIFLQVALEGWGFKYLWSESMWLQEHMVSTLAPVFYLFLFLFLSEFLSLRRNSVKGFLLCWGVVLVQVATALATIFLDAFNSAEFGVGIMIFSSISGFAFIPAILKQQKPAYFLMGWLFVIVASGVAVTHTAGIFMGPWNINHVYRSLLCGSLISFSFALAERMSKAREDRRLLKEVLAGQVPKTVLNELLDHPDHLNLEGTEKTVTIMFLDIVGFSHSSSLLKPKEAFAELKDHLNDIKEVIRKYGGTIDRSLGDGILCFFGYALNGRDQSDHASMAFRAASDIQRQSVQKILDRSRRGKAVFPFRIGINTDKVFIGNLGDQHKIDYTMIGNAVNFASRLESACNPFKIMISTTTKNLLNQYEYKEEALNKILVKMKHFRNLQEAYEYNLYFNNNEPIIEAEKIYWSFVGYSTRELRYRLSNPGDIFIESEVGRFEVVDFSESGFGVIGDNFLGRGVNFLARLTNVDNRLSQLLDQQSLSKVNLEVCWARPSGTRFKHGLKLTGLNSKQIEYINYSIRRLFNTAELNPQESPSQIDKGSA